MSSHHRSTTSGPAFVVAYLAHLVLPVVLTIDIIVSWRLYSLLGRVELLILVGSGLWLGTGLALLLLDRLRLYSLSYLRKPLISLYSLYLSILIIELILITTAEGTDQPSLWRPGAQETLEPDPVHIPGVLGTANFNVNEVGLRGPAVPQDEDVYKIVAVGGSTTESLYLDDLETWTHLLMELLNAQPPGSQVWVANGGQSGRNAVDHLTLIKNAPFFRQVDMLIFLIGFNDLSASLAHEGEPTQEILERNSRQFALRITGEKGPFFRRLQLFQLLRDIASTDAQSGVVQQTTGIQYTELRKQRSISPVVPLIDLQVGLTEYETRVRNIAHWCQQMGIDCRFLTQPTMAREDLDSFEESLLWMGPVGGWRAPKGYLSPGDLAKAIGAYNSALLDVCERDGLGCYDLEAFVPKDVSAFYDEVHFSEHGARIVAKLLADYLSSTSHFGGVGSTPVAGAEE